MKIKLGFGAILMLLALIFTKDKTSGIIIIASAFVHEMGHIFAAKTQKIRLSEMTLDFAGAKIRPEGGILPYGKEFLLCAGGPMSNVIIAFIALGISGAFIEEDSGLLRGIWSGILWGSGEIDVYPAWRGEFLEAFASENLASTACGTDTSEFLRQMPEYLFSFAAVSLSQAAINLLPIRGLDGGRMLEVTLSYLFGIYVSAVALKAISFVCTGVLWIISLYFLLRKGIGLGLFAFSATIFLQLTESFMTDGDRE